MFRRLGKVLSNNKGALGCLDGSVSINCGAATGMTGANELTFYLRIKFNSLLTGRLIVGHSGTDYTNRSIFIQPSTSQGATNLFVLLQTGQGSNAQRWLVDTTNAGLVVDKWYDIFIRCDCTVASGTIYVNGTSVSMNVTQAFGGTLQACTENFYFGWRKAGDYAPIADYGAFVMWKDIQLSIDQMDRIRNSHIKETALGIRPDLIKGAWLFDGVPDQEDAVGRTLFDYSLSGYDAVVDQGQALGIADQDVSYRTGAISVISSPVGGGEIITTATPSLINITLNLNTPTSLISTSKIASPSVSTSSILVGTASASTSATVSSIATTSLELVRLTVGTAIASTAASVSAIATPSVASSSLTVNTPVTVIQGNATATPSVVSVSVNVNSVTITGGASNTATPSLASVMATIQTPTVSISNGRSVQPSLVTSRFNVNSPDISIIQSRTVTPDSLQTTVKVFTASATQLGLSGIVNVILEESKISKYWYLKSGVN